MLLSILIGVLFQSYGYISTTAINLQAHTSIQKELLYVMQSLQNDLDTTTILSQPTSGDLRRNKTIQLQQQSGSIITYFNQCDTQQRCWIVRKEDWSLILLTDPEKVNVGFFEVANLVSWKAKWFRLHMNLLYSKNKTITQNIQTFFTSK